MGVIDSIDVMRAAEPSRRARIQFRLQRASPGDAGSWRAIDETAFGLPFCYRRFFALALSPGIPMQVIVPSVS
jgi:hypothetical protein